MTIPEIPNGIARIGEYAFYSCENLSSVILPESVTYIGWDAFGECPSLSCIVILRGVSTIEEHAFGYTYGDYGTVEKVSGFTIYGYTGTTAEAYAIDNEFAFVDLATAVCPFGHTWDDGQETTMPSCTESGERTYTCTVCGETSVEIIPALGHDFVDSVCTRCGKEQTAHDMFSDVPDTAYYAASVLWAVQNGVTSGTGPNTFSPKKTCTRAEVMTFLWKAYGSPEPASMENPFTDVKPGKYYEQPVLWAYYHNPQVTGGLNATTFGVKNSCTRAQVVMFLWAAAGKPEPTGTTNPFSDVKETDYFYKAVLWAVENGITGGTSPTTFSPKQTCTRAQVVTFLYKAVG